MKKIILLLSNLLFVFQFAFSQINPQQFWAHQYLACKPDSLNPSLALQRIDSALHILYPGDVSEGGPIRSFERDRELAEARLPVSSTPIKYALAYNTALLNAAKQANPFGCTGTYTGTFTNIGPENKKDYQNQGWISDIWVDEFNPQKMIVGSENGGLFQTIDNGATWHNMSDNAMSVGTFGINSFAVNPFNTDEIYFATRNHGQWSGTWEYGMGIWHSLDHGASWQLVSSGNFPPTVPLASTDEFLTASKIAFLSYKIGGEAYVVMSILNHVIGKKSSSTAWTDLTPDGIEADDIYPSEPPGIASPFWLDRVTNINDFEFPWDDPSLKGTIIASSSFVDPSNQSICGVYKITIHQTTGALTSPPGAHILFNSRFNDAVFNDGGLYEFRNLGYPWAPATIADPGDMMIVYSTEYIGNGNFYTLGQASNLFVEPFVTLPVESCYGSVFKWNLNSTVIPGTDLIDPSVSTGLFPFTYIHQNVNMLSYFINKMECSLSNTTADPNIIYLGVSSCAVGSNHVGGILYRDNAPIPTWTFKELTSSDELHLDTRSIFIYQSNLNVTNPGQNDIVFYGNDGGLTKITGMDVFFNPSSVSADHENMNGPGLYIADMKDVDNAGGKGITGAAWHDGYYVFNKMNNTWISQISGDGTNAKVDTRFNPTSGFRMIYQNSQQVYVPLVGTGRNEAYFLDFTSGSSAFPTFNPIKYHPQEISQWVYNPMHFVGNRMDFGIRESWFSVPGAYGGTTGSGWTRYFPNPSTIKTLARQSKCLAFQVAPSDPNVAYNVLHGEVVQGTPPPITNTWRLARGFFNGAAWSWQDKTEPLISFVPPGNGNFNYRYSDMVIDPKNADRLFVSYSGLIWGTPNTHRVHVSSDGGNTFDDMSNGLTQLPVNCLAYQEGSDDVGSVIFSGGRGGLGIQALPLSHGFQPRIISIRANIPDKFV